MQFRKAVEADLPGIMNIIRQAQDYMKQCGIDQWQDGYPNEETIRNDMKHGYSYVLTNGNEVLGTVAVIFGIEKTYNIIYEGQWLSHGSYVTVHRIAVASEHKGTGLAGVMMKHIEAMCLDRDVHSMKVDTHEDNKSMQNFLRKNGFQYCGIIYLEDGSKRVAFEKLISA
jgi:GNAT superfamily N-acetyltransferase